MSEWIAIGAPTLDQPAGRDGPVSERRICSQLDVAEQGMATTVAEHGLISVGRDDLSMGVYVNRIGAPSYRPGMSSLDTPEEVAVVTQALFIGHVRAGHCAWLEDGAIVCVDCERRSEELAKQLGL